VIYDGINRDLLLGQVKYILQWNDFEVIAFCDIPSTDYYFHNYNSWGDYGRHRTRNWYPREWPDPCVAFRVRIMYEGENTVMVRAGWDNDAPCFRWTNKSEFEKEIKFKTKADLKAKLSKLINESWGVNMRPIQSKDVVRIIHPQLRDCTGVVNRRCEITGMINVFIKNQFIGIWFFEYDLKRIGRIKWKYDISLGTTV
jgi:hypothetical protein